MKLPKYARPVRTKSLASSLGLIATLWMLVPAMAQREPSTSSGVPIAVLPLGLSAQTAERYPQLSERSVGFGVHNMLVESLYDTGRFRLVEEKQEVIEDILERQWTSASGAVSKDSAVGFGKLLGARYVLYGEVYDFSSQRIKKKVSETRIALQVRLVNVETSEYVPASGAGTVQRKGSVFARSDGVEFARSTVGQATESALRQAVERLMRRVFGQS